MRDVLFPCEVCRGLLPSAAALRVREAPLRPATFLHWECFDRWIGHLLRAAPQRPTVARSPGAQPLPLPDAAARIEPPWAASRSSPGNSRRISTGS